MAFHTNNVPLRGAPGAVGSLVVNCFRLIPGDEASVAFVQVVTTNQLTNCNGKILRCVIADTRSAFATDPSATANNGGRAAAYAAAASAFDVDARKAA